jgi:heme/copper-type cytochrome/quinol oxidase subunit 2
MLQAHKKIIAIVVGVVLVIVVLGIVVSKRGPFFAPPVPVPATSTESSVPVTREAAPVNVVIPGENATNTPENVAVPDTVSRGSSADPSVSQRGYSIQAENDQFTPNTVIVKLGDLIDIHLTAVDKAYDFTQPDFGFHADVAQGTVQRIQWTATDIGKFIFYCKSCGGPSQGPIGYIIIVK